MSRLFAEVRVGEVDLGPVEQGFKAAERRARNLGTAFRELKKPLGEDQKDHGRRQRGPFGQWARRKPSTLAFYRSRGKGRVPRPMGRLPRAVAYESNALGVYGVSRARWSEVHQDGGTAGKGARIRARPFLWLSPKLLDIAENTIERKLLDAYEGK